jgi:2-polyprenyl-6-methoxyphenol hydroxylase-like FAD-dependent oxidoreductase
MSMTPDVDVIVAGGGIAGAATAAALQQLGYDVMVVEPGQHDERRLAGELFHPPGVSGLAELGLLPTLSEQPAATLSGFSVYCKEEHIRLPYDAVPNHGVRGLCLEHRLIRQRLLDAVTGLPNVVVKYGTRVVAIDQSNRSHVAVGVGNGKGAAVYHCRMLVIADGSPSRLARLAGIAVHQRRISTVWAYRIGTANLPQRDFGHVFVGAATPILLYPLSRDSARMLFDIPYRSGCRPTAADCVALAHELPDTLREEITHAIGTGHRMSVVTRATTTDHIACGRVVLVGDAGGCCHPLTATGMTMSVSDALLLRQAVAERSDNIPAALQLYERRRCWPQATRLVLADALRDAFCGTTPELRVVRGGILALWRDSAQTRSATVALLSTADGRPLALMRRILAVMVRGLIVHWRNPKPENKGIGVFVVARALLAMFVRNIKQVLRGTTVVRYRPAGTAEHPRPLPAATHDA